ncbi:MAG: 4-hydroxy-tetrahydrodipicolinate reductase [Gammaproteobacteria bacterium]
MSPTQGNHPIINIALLGAAGRMGRTLMETAHDFPGAGISAAVVSVDSLLVSRDAGGLTYTADLEKALTRSDVLVDFSTPASTAIAVDTCVAACKPLVTGVTGLDGALKEKLTLAARSIPVLVAPNMSLGAVLLMQLARTAASALGEDFAVEIKDQHHSHKKDAPSGTALALGEAVAAGRAVELKERAIFEMPGQISPTKPGGICFTSIRQGEIVGNHTVTFTGSAEQVELAHRAQSRAAFAYGALTAACWIVNKQPGMYAMADVLGFQARRA